MASDSPITNIVYALAIPFACGVAVQRLLAILDAIDEFLKLSPKWKAWTSAVISFLCGLIVSCGGRITILTAIAGALSIRDSIFNPAQGPEIGLAHAIDVIATALIVSGGTEGFNSIIKFLGYAKEQKKAQAVEEMRTPTAKPTGTDALNLVHS